ncbi:hypothetical protein MBLNU457_3081t1 [Dothideomycetes sp. NU457]
MSAPAPMPPTEDLKHPIAPGVGVAQSVRSASTATEDAGHGDVEKQAQAQDQEAGNDLTQVKSKAPSEFEYPSTAKAMVIMSGLYLAIFLVALDRTIIGTAIPYITNEFHSFSDIGWYQSAYMLTTAGLQLLFGRIYTFYSPKWTYIIAITIFEIGSAISGAAPSSVVLIVGRAISGIGGAGMFGGSMVIIFNVLPLHKRPLFMGLIGGVFGIASVVGPLLGGVFTTYVSWRWCFYINLPVGAVTIILLLIVLRQDFTMAAAGKSTREKILQLDPLGTVCFIPALICLLLALQWGGSTYAWSDGRIIACLVLFAVLLIAFCVLQCVRPENRCTVPVRIVKNRSIVGGFWFTIFGGGTMVILALYIPIWFQAIKGIDPVQSGIRTIPLILAMVIFIIMSGALIQRIGYYTPFMIAGAVIMPIGCGLISTWTPNSGANQWIGYQVFAGIGMGMALQQPNIAAQTVLARKDASMGVGLMILGQTMGGAIFASVSQNVIDTQLLKNLTQHPIAGINPASIVNAGATNLRKLVPAADLANFLDLYNNAITRGLLVAVGCSAATIVGALMMEWVSTKKDKKPKAQPAAAVEEKPVSSSSEV